MPTEAALAGDHDRLGTVLDEIRRAIRLEHDDWRNRRRVERIHLGPGALIFGRVPTYRFRKGRHKVLPYPAGTTVEVVFERAPVAVGTVIAQTPATIDLTVGYHGPRTPCAAIIWDPAWLVEELAQTMQGLYPTPLIQAVLGLRRCGPRAYRPLVLPHDHLDEEQYSVLHAAASETYALLEGPPGTGKSRVLVSLIRELRARGQAVLVAAPSHVAGDVLTERLLDVLEAGEGRELGQVVRWGTPQSDRLHRYALDSHKGRTRNGLWLHDGSDADAARAAMLEADVLITTTARCFIQGGMPRRFDAVVVDEGGMCTVPTILAAAKHASGSLIVAGDPQQLGPLVHSHAALVTRWLRRTVFDIAEESGTVPLLRLTTQYRMAPKIAALVGRLSYGGRLVTAPQVLGRPVPESALGSDQLVLIDTSGHGKRGTTRLEDSHHAAVIGHVARLLIQSAHETDDARVLALTRYRAQVRRIIQALGSNLRGLNVAEASTVHAAQGREADAVILDLIPASIDWLGDYLTDGIPRSDGSRILTVAASRAIHRLLVIADVEYLLDRLPRRAAARRLIDALRQEAMVLGSQEVLSLRHSSRLRLEAGSVEANRVR